jgi:hypothetical protein
MVRVGDLTPLTTGSETTTFFNPSNGDVLGLKHFYPHICCEEPNEDDCNDCGTGDYLSGIPQAKSLIIRGRPNFGGQLPVIDGEVQ